MKKLILLFVVLPLMTSPLAAVADELDTPAVAKPVGALAKANLCRPAFSASTHWPFASSSEPVRWRYSFSSS